jgi:hypothetical protein
MKTKTERIFVDDAKWAKRMAEAENKAAKNSYSPVKASTATVIHNAIMVYQNTVREGK